MRLPKLLFLAVTLSAVGVAVYLWQQLHAEREINSRLHNTVVPQEVRTEPVSPAAIPAPQIVTEASTAPEVSSDTSAASVRTSASESEMAIRMFRAMQPDRARTRNPSPAEATSLLSLLNNSAMASVSEFRTALQGSREPLEENQEKVLIEIVRDELLFQAESAHRRSVGTNDLRVRLDDEEYNLPLWEESQQRLIAASRSHLNASQVQVIEKVIDREAKLRQERLKKWRAELAGGGE